MRRRVRRLGVTPLGWWLLVAVWLLAAAAVPLLGAVLTARAEEVDPPRFQPADRGNRPAHRERWEVLDLVAAHFPPEQVDAAMAVLVCESRLDPGATGRLGERGYFQIHPLWQPLAEALYWPGVSLYDAEVNVAVAAAIWRADGWAPWSCRPW